MSVQQSALTEQPLFLIGDSGATRTRLCLVDSEGQIVRHAVTGPGNAFAIGWSKALTSITAGLQRVLKARSLAKRIRAAVVGSASVTQHGEGSSRIVRIVRAFAPQATVRVLSDMRIALQGALGDNPGVVIVSGTGSVVLGKADGLRYVQVGGWGMLIGDEGSSQWIAREGLRRAAHAFDGTGPATQLQAAFLKHFGVNSFYDLLPMIYEDPTPASLGALAVLVVRMAKGGDQVARAVIREAGEALGVQAAVVTKRLRLICPQVSYQGSVFQAGKIILNPVRKTLKKLCPDARLVPPILPPLGGAWLHALGIVGLTPTQESIAAFGGNYNALFESRLGKD
ncbi:MAG TPA: BadF/BadG/BcrA/BcrD ATPase family protein [Terriglobia bacterium]|nr:BadF/BadG/BcrA/BcrD ATPase family protein [Terriglobia bacterium]